MAGGTTVTAWQRYTQTVQQHLYLIGASVWLRIGICAAAVAFHVMFFLPRMPASGATASVPGIDKLGHFALFAVTAWAVGRLCAPLKRFPMGWVVLALMIEAIGIELLQSLHPQRAADIWDLLADVVGIACGVVAWYVEQQYAHRTLQQRSIP